MHLAAKFSQNGLKTTDFILTMVGFIEQSFRNTQSFASAPLLLIAAPTAAKSKEISHAVTPAPLSIVGV